MGARETKDYLSPASHGTPSFFVKRHFLAKEKRLDYVGQAHIDSPIIF